jgi:hypothetical protein
MVENMSKSVITANDVMESKTLAIEVLKMMKLAMGLGDMENMTLAECAALDMRIKALEREVNDEN